QCVTCPLWADTVEKVVSDPPKRNNRIRTARYLNRNCVRGRDCESMLRIQGHKIVFQQYRPEPDMTKGASERPQRPPARWLVAARNFGWKISKNAWDAGINDLSESRRIPIRRVIAGRRGFTVIEDPLDGGTAEAGTMAMPSPRDTKSKSELNWLVMILWLNTTPRSLAATSSVRRNPESLGIEIMGSSPMSLKDANDSAPNR